MASECFMLVRGGPVSSPPPSDRLPVRLSTSHIFHPSLFHPLLHPPSLTQRQASAPGSSPRFSTILLRMPANRQKVVSEGCGLLRSFVPPPLCARSAILSFCPSSKVSLPHSLPRKSTAISSYHALTIALPLDKSPWECVATTISFNASSTPPQTDRLNRRHFTTQRPESPAAFEQLCRQC